MSRGGVRKVDYNFWGFAQSDRLKLRQIRAQILPSYFLPSPKRLVLCRYLVFYKIQEIQREKKYLSP